MKTAAQMAAIRPSVAARVEAARQNYNGAGVFSGSRYGRADVGIGPNLMNALIQGLRLNLLKHERRLTKQQFESQMTPLIAIYNSNDGQVVNVAARIVNGVSKKAYRYSRPKAYVPYINATTLKIVVPNETKINRRTSKGYYKSSGHPLIPLFGAEHMKMLGITRPRGGDGRINWDTQGNMRLKIHSGGGGGGNRVSTKTFGWYRSAAGGWVAITASSTSRLAQLVVNSNGSLGGQGVPTFVRNTRFTGGSMTFSSPNSGARGL